MADDFRDTVYKVTHPDWRVCLASALLQWDQQSSSTLRVAVKIVGDDVFTIIAKTDGMRSLFTRPPGQSGVNVFYGPYDELVAFVEEHKDDADMWRARG